MNEAAIRSGKAAAIGRPLRHSLILNGTLWSGGVIALLLAAHLRNPMLLLWRSPATWFLATVPFAIAGLLSLHRFRNGVRHSAALRLLWLSAMLVAGMQQGIFEWRKHQVLTELAPSIESALPKLGQHLVVGFSDWQAVRVLAERGLIGGIFVTTQNIRGRSPEAIRSEISALQDSRVGAGLPPLIVTTDQEGGIVSRLSPPLSPMPPLAEVIGNARPDEIESLAFAYGRYQGRELAALGININLAPLADLSSRDDHHHFDFRSLIGRRAIGEDPLRVSAAVTGYAHGLEQAGLRATLKHFPGLGRVRSDTHIMPATLAASENDLESRDWIPFRHGLQATQSLLMVGHATLNAVDDGKPASLSEKVIQGIVRERWGHDGVLITDDLSMGAVVRHGLCSAGVEALNAGADLLLVSYDAEQFYEVLACLQQADRRGTLNTVRLNASHRRLETLQRSLKPRNIAPGNPAYSTSATSAAPSASVIQASSRV